MSGASMPGLFAKATTSAPKTPIQISQSSTDKKVLVFAPTIELSKTTYEFYKNMIQPELTHPYTYTDEQAKKTKFLTLQGRFIEVLLKESTTPEDNEELKRLYHFYRDKFGITETKEIKKPTPYSEYFCNAVLTLSVASLYFLMLAL